MPQKFANRAKSLLQSTINSSATSLAVASADADEFSVADTGTDPVNTAGKDWFKLVLIDTSGNYEIMHARSRTLGSGSISNIIRGQDGTTAIGFNAGSFVVQDFVAEDLNDLLAEQASQAALVADRVTKAEVQNQTYTAFTTSGTGSAYTLNAVPDAATYAANQAFDVTFHAASSGSPTIAVDSQTAKSLMYMNSVGTKVTVGALLPANWRSKIIYDGTDFVVQTMPPAAGLAGLAGLLARNRIINGKMVISQRGTTFTAANNIYTLDRWSTQKSTSAVYDVIQSTDVPNNEFQYSLRSTVTTADAAIAAGDYDLRVQGIEGFNVRDLIGRTFTISFWVRSSETGVHCISLRNSGNDRSYVAEYTITAANTWEKKSITITGGLITTGTWNWASGIGLSLSFVLAGGSTWQTTPGAWQNGNFMCTSSQVNCLDTIGNIFAFTGVQVEVGSEATQFEHRHHSQELALCQRYYEKGYSEGVVPGTNTSRGLVLLPTVDGGGSVYVGCTQSFRVEKRLDASTMFYWDVVGNASRISTYTGGGLSRTDNVNALTSLTTSSSGFAAIGLPGASNFAGFHWVAVAEF